MDSSNIKKNIIDYLKAFFIISSGIVFGFFLVEILFRVGAFFIIVFSIPLSLIIGAPAALVSLLLAKFIFKLQKNITIPIVLSLTICTAIILIGKNVYSPAPAVLLERFLIKENSYSVTNIEGVIEYPSIDHIVRLSFNISQKDYNFLITDAEFEKSNENFPLNSPTIKSYLWWDSQELTTLQQYKRNLSNEYQYIWYDSNKNVAWFMSLDI